MGKWVCENVMCSMIEVCQWENPHTLECKYRKKYLDFMLGRKPPKDTPLGKLLIKRMQKC